MTAAIDFRAVGYTAEAINYPLSPAAFAWLCRFNGTTPDKAPQAWGFAPNAEMKRMMEARAEGEGSSLRVFDALALGVARHRTDGAVERSKDEGAAR